MNYSEEVALLNTLCDLYGSDKGSVSTLSSSRAYSWAPHTYTEVYARILAPLKDSAITLFECGLGTNNQDVPSNMGSTGKPGASLRVWRDYLPNASIYGADVDSRVLFEEPRIKTGYLDQTNPQTIREFWSQFEDFTPDVVIDDGLHTYLAATTLYGEVWPRLASGGVYVIEDVLTTDLPRYHSWLRTCGGNASVISLIRPDQELRDNTLIVIRKD